MTRSLPAAPADDLFSDDFITPMDVAVRDARRPVGNAVVVEAPVVHRCHRCSRVLSDPKSVSRGYGATCWRRVSEALALIGQTFSARQIVAATELISDGGVVVGPKGACLAVSSDGAGVYAVNPLAGTCTCKAGQYGRLCYHLCSALALTI